MSQLAFLDYLELDESADERAIRRAYARKLKTIDQELEPAAFQALREAYEVAMQWARWQQQQNAQGADVAHEALAQPVETEPAAASCEKPTAPEKTEEDVVDRLDESQSAAAIPTPLEPKVAPGVVDAVTNPDDFLSTPTPEEAARSVFSELMVWLSGNSNAAGWSSDKVHYDHLQRCLDDPRLLPIAARDYFEWYVAERLASGWQPGQEALLVAAIRIFEWQDDAPRLLRFGVVGGRINQSIVERVAFDQQPEAVKKLQRDLFARLRDPAPPSRGELASKLQKLEWLVSRFPNWVPLISSMENLERWRIAKKGLQRKKQPLSSANPDLLKQGVTEHFPAPAGSAPMWMIVLFVIGGIKLLGTAAGPSMDLSPFSPSSPIYWYVPTGGLSSGQMAQDPSHDHSSIGYQTSEQKPPELPEEKLILALETGAPSQVKCAEIARLAQVFKIGSGPEQAWFSAALERQLIQCVNAGFWPRPAVRDPAYKMAVAQEEKRNRAMKGKHSRANQQG